MTCDNITVQNIRRIAEAMEEIEDNDSLSEKTANLRLDALKRLSGYLRALIGDNHFMPELVDTICTKKIAFIMRAETLGEIREIMSPPHPVYRAGQIECTSPYHIDEEELLMWVHISPHNNLISAAYERFTRLFEKIFGVLS